MKKIIYSLGLFSFIILSLSFISKVEAQNIGSLRDVVSPGFSFTMDLYPGYTDSDVKELQKVLNADVDTTIALDGEGSRNRETKYFGDQTKLAVVKFQEKYRDTILTPSGLTSGTGIVGKATRTKLNLLIGVMNTGVSSGSPESRGTNTAVNTITPVVTTISTPVSQPVMTVCNFVELLINIQVIGPANAARARSALNCTNGGNVPSVDIRVNDRSGTVSISSPRNVTISWTSNNVTSCKSDSGRSRSLSGSDRYYVDESGTFVISCTGPYGTVTDSVVVRLLNNDDEDADEDALTASCTPSSSNVLTNSSITWTARANGGDGDYTYYWSGTDGLSATTTNPYVSKTYTLAGIKTVTLKVVSDGTSRTVNCSTTVSSSAGSIVTDNKVLESDGDSLSMVSVKKSSSLDLKNRITLEAWVNPSEWADKDDVTKRSDNVIISKGDINEHIDYALTLDNGKLGFSNNEGGLYTCQSLVPLDTWTHVAVTVEEGVGAVKFYVNGQEVSSLCNASFGKLNKYSAITENTKTAKATATTTANRGNIHIANFQSPVCDNETGNGFVGKLDDVRIWNIARSAEDIATGTKSVSSTASGLVARYNFDSLTYTDLSSSHNDGFQKGNARIVADSSSPSTATASTFNFSSFSIGSFLDPDGYCEVPSVEVDGGDDAAGPERFFDFAGVVTSVERCESGSDMELWMAEIRACKQGEVVSTQNLTGISSSEEGYIVIRKGHQDVPSVGDVVLGTAVDDHGLECGNNNMRYIGTVTGAMESGSDEFGECGVTSGGLIDRIRELIRSGKVDPKDLRSVSDVRSAASSNGFDISSLSDYAITGSILSPTVFGTTAAGAFLNPFTIVSVGLFDDVADGVSGVVEDVGDGIADTFGW
jgi:hypothetical protein